MSQVIVKDIHTSTLGADAGLRLPTATSVPSNATGTVGDLVFVKDDATPANTALYIRYPLAWKKITAV